MAAISGRTGGGVAVRSHFGVEQGVARAVQAHYAGAGALRLCNPQELAAGGVEIGQGRGHQQAMQVLLEPAVWPVPGEWHPRMPERLDEEELADWQAGRSPR
jgi:hypothetical protein